MGISIEGWVEYSSLDLEERSSEYAWQSFMRIDSIIDAFDNTTNLLFGNPRNFDIGTNCIAKSRGFPSNPSKELDSDIQWIKEYIKVREQSEFFGFTNCIYSEIQAANLEIDTTSDWQKLFRIIDLFQHLKGFSAEQIRLTVWFNW